MSNLRNELDNEISNQESENDTKKKNIFSNSFLKFKEKITSIDFLEIKFEIEPEHYEYGKLYFPRYYYVSFSKNEKFKQKNINLSKYEDDTDIFDEKISVDLEREFGDTIFDEILTQKELDIFIDYLEFIDEQSGKLYDLKINLLSCESFQEKGK